VSTSTTTQVIDVDDDTDTDNDTGTSQHLLRRLFFLLTFGALCVSITRYLSDNKDVFDNLGGVFFVALGVLGVGSGIVLLALNPGRVKTVAFGALCFCTALFAGDIISNMTGQGALVLLVGVPILIAILYGALAVGDGRNESSWLPNFLGDWELRNPFQIPVSRRQTNNGSRSGRTTRANVSGNGNGSSAPPAQPTRRVVSASGPASQSRSNPTS